MAGPVSLKMEKFNVKDVASARSHTVTGKVIGGYDENSGTVVVQVVELIDADPRLFSPATRIRLQVIRGDHRVTVLLAQLARSLIRVEVNVPRVPLTTTTPTKLDLLCDVREVALLEQVDSLEEIRNVLVQQLNLDM